MGPHRQRAPRGRTGPFVVSTRRQGSAGAAETASGEERRSSVGWSAMCGDHPMGRASCDARLRAGGSDRMPTRASCGCSLNVIRSGRRPFDRTSSATGRAITADRPPATPFTSIVALMDSKCNRFGTDCPGRFSRGPSYRLRRASSAYPSRCANGARRVVKARACAGRAPAPGVPGRLPPGVPAASRPFTPVVAGPLSPAVRTLRPCEVPRRAVHASSLGRTDCSHAWHCDRTRRRRLWTRRRPARSPDSTIPCGGGHASRAAPYG
jgi:hypothetical protein